MGLSMYTASVSHFQRMLSNCEAILRKAEAHAVARKVEPEVFLKARLFPDMFPLIRQVQLVCDFSVRPIARLAGIDIPSFKDTEVTFEDLYTRINNTQQFIGKITKDQLEGSDARSIQFTAGGKEFNFDGASYLVEFVLPNFHFHLTTAYAILRHNGVEVGKWDFLGVL